jgi:hypothetical protein
MLYRACTLLAGAAVVLAAAACASPGPPPDARVVDIGDMDGSLLEDDTPLVIRVPEGTRLPVQVTLATPFVSSEGGDPAFTAVFDRDVYWYPGKAHQISFDGETWQDFNEGHEGMLSFGMGNSADEGPKGTVFVGLGPK